MFVRRVNNVVSLNAILGASKAYECFRSPDVSSMKLSSLTSTPAARKDLSRTTLSILEELQINPVSMIRLRPSFDPLLYLGQLEDAFHEGREVRRRLLPVVGDPVAEHVHRVRHHYVGVGELVADKKLAPIVL